MNFAPLNASAKASSNATQSPDLLSKLSKATPQKPALKKAEPQVDYTKNPDGDLGKEDSKTLKEKLGFILFTLNNQKDEPQRACLIAMNLQSKMKDMGRFSKEDYNPIRNVCSNNMCLIKTQFDACMKSPKGWMMTAAEFYLAIVNATHNSISLLWKGLMIVWPYFHDKGTPEDIAQEMGNMIKQAFRCLQIGGTNVEAGVQEFNAATEKFYNETILPGIENQTIPNLRKLKTGEPVQDKKSPAKAEDQVMNKQSDSTAEKEEESSEEEEEKGEEEEEEESSEEDSEQDEEADDSKGEEAEQADDPLAFLDEDLRNCEGNLAEKTRVLKSKMQEIKPTGEIPKLIYPKLKAFDTSYSVCAIACFEGDKDLAEKEYKSLLQTIGEVHLYSRTKQIFSKSEEMFKDMHKPILQKLDNFATIFESFKDLVKECNEQADKGRLTCADAILAQLGELHKTWMDKAAELENPKKPDEVEACDIDSQPSWDRAAAEAMDIDPFKVFCLRTALRLQSEIGRLYFAGEVDDDEVQESVNVTHQITEGIDALANIYDNKKKLGKNDEKKVEGLRGDMLEAINSLYKLFPRSKPAKAATKGKASQKPEMVDDETKPYGEEPDAGFDLVEVTPTTVGEALKRKKAKRDAKDDSDDDLPRDCTTVEQHKAITGRQSRAASVNLKRPLCIGNHALGTFERVFECTLDNLSARINTESYCAMRAKNLKSTKDILSNMVHDVKTSTPCLVIVQPEKAKINGKETNVMQIQSGWAAGEGDISNCLALHIASEKDIRLMPVKLRADASQQIRDKIQPKAFAKRKSTGPPAASTKKTKK